MSHDPVCNFFHNFIKNLKILIFKILSVVPKQSSFVAAAAAVEKKTVIEKPEIVYSDPFNDVYVKKEVPETVKEDDKVAVLEVEEKIIEKVKVDETTEPVLCDTPVTTANLSNNNASNISEMMFFYQSNDGQRIYISGLNSRCLTAEYGASLAQAPLVITGRIVAAESHFMTEENRRRFKFLAHLPLHTEFKIAELDLAEPYVSRGTLTAFQDEIDERRATRQRKLNKEKREADRAAAAAAQLESEPHYYVASAMHDQQHGLYLSSVAEQQPEHIFADMSEFPEASSSPPASSSASVGGQSSSGASSGGGLVDPNIAAAAQASFAAKLKHQNSGELTAAAAWGGRGGASGLSGVSSVNAWPSLDSAVAQQPPVTAAKTQMTSGWLTMVKQQQQQGPVLGRTKKYQNPPAPWGSAGGGGSAAAKPARVDGSSSQESHDDEEKDAMPAPLYQQSFFSAIDESFRLIESSKCLLKYTNIFFYGRITDIFRCQFV
jgi:hypothetical protein